MLHCIHCHQPIHAAHGASEYIHDETHSAFCDAPELDRARENGFRVAAKQARPDLKEVTLKSIHELAPRT